MSLTPFLPFYSNVSDPVFAVLFLSPYSKSSQKSNIWDMLEPLMVPAGNETATPSAIR
jgi:hypothetical protein